MAIETGPKDESPFRDYEGTRAGETKTSAGQDLLNKFNPPQETTFGTAPIDFKDENKNYIHWLNIRLIDRIIMWAGYIFGIERLGSVISRIIGLWIQ